VIAKVRYGTTAPWPSTPTPGSSLQLIDSHQDNWRVGNWAVSQANPLATPAALNNTSRSLPPFPTLWINELQADNVTGITNSAGQRSAWLELYNPGVSTIGLGGLFLATSYANLTQWPFPSNATISPGQFKLIFADGKTNLSTLAELHTSFVLPSAAGSLALSRITNAQVQVLDYVDYTNLPADYSYGSLPNGQSFDRQPFFHGTPGTSNGVVLPPASSIPYAFAGAVYHQNFDSLPNPGATSVNSANPVTINGVTYSLANPYDFAGTPIESGGIGGLGLANLAGWFGWGATGAKFGATDGDQTTGGQISFGLPGSANRALGLLATSSTGRTAFGARLINQTATTLTRMSLQVVGELWRQSDLPKTLEFHYFLDLSATNTLFTNVTALVPELNMTFPTLPSAVGGIAADGTAAGNQLNVGVTDLAITNWPPGAVLWLVWQMNDVTGKAQGVAIDNVAFSASVESAVGSIPVGIELVGSNVVLSWSSLVGQTYQIEYKDDLNSPTWIPLGNAIPGTGSTISVSNAVSTSTHRFFRLAVLP